MSFFTFIFKNLLRRRARSLLTTCGVAVAVATTIALLGVAEDFQNAVLQSLKNEGSDIVVSPKGELMQIAGDMNEEFGEQIAEVPGVHAIAYGLIEQIAMDINGDQIPVLLQGWKHGTFSFSDLEIVQGRMLDPDEEKSVLLGSALAEKLGAEVDQTIELQEEMFRVVGIFESSTILKRGSAVMLLHVLQDLMLREGSVTGFSVQVDPKFKDDQQETERIANAIDALTDSDGNSLRLEATPTDAFVRNNFQLRLTRAMAWITSLIAIGVGTIGMLNTMIMSVMERVREISVLRAMGWKKRRVVAMIVGESVVLSLAGAIVGAVVAVVGSRLLIRLPQISGFLSGNVPAEVVLIGFFIALLVGLIGAAYPAWRATRLAPSEGLRYE